MRITRTRAVYPAVQKWASDAPGATATSTLLAHLGQCPQYAVPAGFR